jgi:hypothetical protein
VFVWTGPDAELDGGFVAGLIAGDGSFSIRPNNGGANWQCAVVVSLRADDTPLLARLCRWSGVGKLSRNPARGNSSPQTSWRVQRQADCQRMVSILDRHRMLGKKRGEYDIWRTAVEAWVLRVDERHTVIADCAARLGAHRNADNVPGCSGVHITDHRLLAFLAGFATAEAHFGATPEGHPHFRINVRRDDGELLRLFRDRLDLGRLADVPPYRTSKAALSWRIGRLGELRVLTEHLDRYPPRGRVLRIYEVWRELVLQTDRRSGKRRQLAAQVKERRAYKPRLGTIVAVDALAARQQRHLAVLRAWASATQGPRTSSAYAAWRRDSRPSAPKRETIAAAFGSWMAAVEAAGLSTHACRSQAIVRKARATAAVARPARVARQRAAILAAVRECVHVLGHPPRAMEFFRWRTQFAPDTPCQMTVYRVFPGGWQSVLDSLLDDERHSSATDQQLLQPAAQAVDVASAAREQLAVEPDVQAGSSDQLRHEGVAGHEVAARQRE